MLSRLNLLLKMDCYEFNLKNLGPTGPVRQRYIPRSQSTGDGKVPALSPLVEEAVVAHQVVSVTLFRQAPCLMFK